MIKQSYTQRTVLLLMVLAVAFLWTADQGIRAATGGRADKVAAPAATTNVSATAATTDSAAPAKTTTTAATTAAASPQKGQAKKLSPTACVVNGKVVDPCPPAVLKQSKRQAARAAAAPQKTGVTVAFAGINPATTAISPLAPVTALATGGAVSAMAAFGAQPDYFAVGNYANSPLPQVSGGAIVLGTGMRKFQDELPGICGVSPWGATGTNGLGQCIPLATPDTTTFPGSDFYRIGILEYNQQMHTDLPAATGTGLTGGGTFLRGYVQLDATNTPVGKQQYLGPLILATRNRPVRMLYKNMLTTELNIPTDITYMGAGTVDDGLGHTLTTTTTTRATIHLHGGNTPWISDGTPHQWTTPVGGAGQPAARGFQKGFSFQNVPDMVNGSGTPCADPTLAACFTPALSDGLGTNFYTNQQSGRLLFYHEHAYGTTRLGVYDGLAAGYLIADPVQETALQAATAPGTIITDPATGAIVPTGTDLAHVVPLVIQDKTFVPDNGAAGGQLAGQDPTWDVTNGGGLGNLWFPHVYMPNQNPADVTGANGYGRWDYGPWFFPPQVASTFVGQPYQCTSAAYPNGAGLAFPPLICPGTPLPSGTPESFMDTPVVNGTAYPKLDVTPSAYRFQVLNASNDRGLNLGLYLAEPVTLSPIITAPGSGFTNPVVTIVGCTGGTAFAQVGDGPLVNGVPTFTAGIVGITFGVQPSACTGPTLTIADTAPGVGSGATANVVMSNFTDVHMLPAIPATAGRALPNCSVKLPMAGGGQITTTLTTPSGLPAGCWPMYSSAQGFTAGTFGENGGQLSWGNSDARVGGVPDPTTAGPPIIQIGAEGGPLPQIAVIPSTPVSFDYNKRSITVLNVLNHGLWLGPAERADIIVDFSQVPAMCTAAGMTQCSLILYNDAPAPIPAGDPRVDYYTNDPDNTSTGGAPSTIAGYGPNMRTIMQINVTGTNNNTTPFSLATLTPALPTIFATAQLSEPPIVPEPVYGNATTPTYIPIQATSINAWVGGPIGAVTLTSGGAGYTSVPAVSITGGGGSGAAGTATLSAASVASFIVTNGGSGYTSAPSVAISGGGGSGASATAVLTTTGGVKTIALTAGGSGYTSAPTVVFSGCTGCVLPTATATVRGNGQRNVTAVTLLTSGSGYSTPPTISFTGGGSGSGARATATLGKSVASVTVVNGGINYASAPTVAFSGGGGTGALATALLSSRVVTGVTVTNTGGGYTSAPTVTIALPTSGTQATASVSAPSVPLQPKTIQELFTLDYGRMNATLGVEVPFTNFLTQTTIPYGYVDPPTEIFKDGETQLWKITHNGVDTHFIHFHLFTVQVINRVGWDGAIKPPDPYELGMKDTVRMNPLEDVIIALRPEKQTLPFAVPNSHRPMDVTHPVGYTSTTTFTNIDPTNQPATVTNDSINFGWEYVWHCHILGHEENDMMRAQVFAVAPAAPTLTPKVTTSGKGKNIVRTVTVTITPAAPTPGFGEATGFTIQRATSAAGPWTTLGTIATNGTNSVAFSETIAVGTYYYRVIANNLVGYTAVYAAPAVGYPSVSADSAPKVTGAVVVQ